MTNTYLCVENVIKSSQILKIKITQFNTFFEYPNLINGVLTKQNIHPQYIDFVESFNIEQNRQ